MAQTKAQLIDGKGDAVVNNKLLVGTSTARNKFFNTSQDSLFQVEGVSGGSQVISHTYGEAGNGGPYLVFTKNRSGTIGGTTVVNDGDQIGAVSFQGSDGSEAVEAARIQAFVDGAPGANDMPGRLVFSTTADGASSPTEACRIDNSQVLIIAGTSAYSDGAIGKARLQFNSKNGNHVGAVCVLDSTSNTGAIAFKNPNGVVGTISTSGSATTYATSSDYRLKENISIVADSITRLQQLKPRRFNFIADPDKTVDGFIAHEVQEVIPEAITGEKDAVDADGNPIYQGIDQSKLVPLLTAALQEAIGRIETLEAEVAALKAQ